MADDYPEKVQQQIDKAGLPTVGAFPFRPKLVRNQAGEDIIEKREVKKGPKRGKRGYVDDQGRIWLKDRAHGDVPDHWDVQIDDGEDYFRVDLDGNKV